MKNTIVVTYGSCIDLDWDFFDVDGNPDPIGEDEFSVFEATDGFEGFVFTKVDPEAGKLHLFLSAEHARKLRLGNENSFRLRRVMPGGCEDNTTEIRVLVQ